MSVPLLVTTVFAATFLVVCAIAYVLLGRSSSAAPVATSMPPPTPVTPIAPVAPEIGAIQPAKYEIHAVRGGTPSIPAPPEPAAQWAPPSDSDLPGITATTNKTTVLRLYRLLMFATGGTGILASALMFSAVTEFSRLVVIAVVVFLLSCGAIYRGFVPDPELTGKK
jgi:hypothetical protein